jgi:hypothetical protein
VTNPRVGREQGIVGTRAKALCKSCDWFLTEAPSNTAMSRPSVNQCFKVAQRLSKCKATCTAQPRVSGGVVTSNQCYDTEFGKVLRGPHVDRVDRVPCQSDTSPIRQIRQIHSPSWTSHSLHSLPINAGVLRVPLNLVVLAVGNRAWPCRRPLVVVITMPWPPHLVLVGFGYAACPKHPPTRGLLQNPAFLCSFRLHSFTFNLDTMHSYVA